MMLDVRLRHRFPSAAIEIAFEAERCVTALFGPSGAGKSTVANAVAGLLRPNEGHVRLNGRLLSGEGTWVPPHRRRVGYVFQDARLFPHLSVRRNLLFGAPARMDIRPVVDLLGIGPLLDRHPAHLSGGERQRVAIGRALLSAPELLVLDEPLSALDPARKKEILPYLDRLTQEAGLPILYISHSVAEIVRLADQVVVLEAGRVAGMGPPASILADPQVSSHLGARVGGAMLQGKVTACAADGLITVRTEAGDLHLPDRFPVGAPVRLRIAAEDVILSVTEPVGLSALNMLHAKVTDLQPDGPMMTVVLRLPDGTPLLARITRRSSAALDLRAGHEVFAILKTAAVMDQS